MGSSKQKSTTKTNQTTTSNPPSWTMPGISEASSRVLGAMQSLPTTHYSGPMVATMNPTDLQGILSAWGATAENAGQQAAFLQSLVPQLQGTTAFSTMLPTTDYSLAPREDLTGVINASTYPVMQQLMTQILPSITSSALEAGAYSGDRAMRVLPTEAISNANEAMQRIAAQLGYEDYQNYENRRLAAFQAQTAAAQGNYALEGQRQAQIANTLLSMPDYVNSILRTQASQGDLLRMAAELETGQRQGGIQDAVQRDMWAAQSPFLGLDTASQLLAMLSGNWGTQNTQGTSTTTQKSTPALLPQIIQGAIGAASMAMGMPPLGALGGAGSGAFGSSLFNALPMTTTIGGQMPMPYLNYNMPQLPMWGG